MSATSSSTSIVKRHPLQDLALAPATFRAYTKQLNDFLQHSEAKTRMTHLQLLTIKPLDLQLDRLLAEYIQHRYNNHCTSRARLHLTFTQTFTL